MADTVPSGMAANDHTPLISLPGSFVDQRSGATWLHGDLLHPVIGPWANEEHISPPKGDERFGDVASWVQFIATQSGDHEPYLTWNARGLRAVLDYHATAENPGRAQWTATYPFTLSRQWMAWMGTASTWLDQPDFIDFIEDHMEDVTEPVAAELLGIVRNMKATVTQSAHVDIRPDGTSNVTWTDDRQVKHADTDTLMPPSLKIAIPALRGHVDDSSGKPIVYGLTAMLRVNVPKTKEGEKPKLQVRFTIPAAETALENAYAEIVSKAAAQIGGGYRLLRAAD